MAAFIYPAAGTSVNVIPAVGASAITPGGSLLDRPSRALFVAANGNLVAKGLDGVQFTINSLTAGTLLPISVISIDTGTTATIVALW